MNTTIITLASLERAQSSLRVLRARASRPAAPAPVEPTVTLASLEQAQASLRSQLARAA